MAAWALLLACVVAFAVAQHRYIANFLMGPFTAGQGELDAIGDATTAPRSFVKVTGSRAIDTGIQQITTRKRGGVETSHSVSAHYYALVVGDRLLLVKSSDGNTLTAEGELTPMSADLQRNLFDGPRMEAIRPRFYPFYVDNASFRLPGYIAIAALFVLAFLLWKFALPAWRYRQDVSSHPVVKRIASWGDPLGLALEIRREGDSPKHKGGGWLVTEQYLIHSAFFVFDVLRLSDLLWGYKKVTKHSVNFIPTGKTYAAILACYGGSAEVSGREKKVDEVLAFAAERAPWAVFGYTDELKKLFIKQTQDFCAAVENRKRERASQHQPRP